MSKQDPPTLIRLGYYDIEIIYLLDNDADYGYIYNNNFYVPFSVTNNLIKNINKFNDDIGKWNVSNVTSMNSTFKNLKSFNRNITKWDVSNVTSMNSMFFNATSFNSDISNWNTSNVINMGSMFEGASSFNQDISTNIINIDTDKQKITWDVSNVSNMNRMFYNDLILVEI